MVAEHASDSRQRELRARAANRLPGGVNSNIRLSSPRVFFEKASGARMWDVDGNEYVDYLLGQGPALLGHGNDTVWSFVTEATRGGMVYGAQHPWEVEAAELLCSTLGWPDMVRFGATGTESVQAALRVARAATGRRKFIRFEGHYHGWLDNVLLTTSDGQPAPASAGQLETHLADSIVLPWNDEAAVTAAFDAHGDDIAAVITEPVMCNTGVIPARDGYLQRLRELCDDTNVVLIFDEVITGFRLALGGAAEHYNVRPDLAVYGKAMAGGWPASALAGRGDLMERFGTGEVNHSGTFNAAVMAAAATTATLRLLNNEPPYQQMRAHGEALRNRLAELGTAHGMPLHIQGFPMVFHVSFGETGQVWDARQTAVFDQQRYAAFAHLLASHGVWVAPRGVWYISAAHGESELRDASARVDDALTEFVKQDDTRGGGQ